jgi:hypothetical protein
MTDPFGVRLTLDRIAGECQLLRSKKDKEVREIADRIQDIIDNFREGKASRESTR